MEKYDKIESGIKSIERFLIMLSVLIIFLLIGWKMGGEYGDTIIIVCGGLIVVLIMVEILLIERHRHRR